MKKVVLAIVMSFIMLIFSSCSTKSVTYKSKVDNSKYVSDSANIKFEYFYRGFATVKDNMVEEYPHDTLIIETDDDWHDFMDKYVPGIPYFISVDYSKEYLVFSSSFGPKPTYCTWAGIKSFTVNENKLEPEYISGAIDGSNVIYAQNIDDIEHFFVNIVKINKKDIPLNIENIYHKQ